MWKDITGPWKVAFHNGWISFINGSIPIGAVIVDETDNIISTGRNRLFENTNLNSKIAHAETECLQNLDINKYPNVKQYTLYTSMEPCPMCMGTIVMSNVRKVKIAMGFWEENYLDKCVEKNISTDMVYDEIISMS